MIAIGCAAGMLLGLPTAAHADELPGRITLGTSHLGKPIVAKRQGKPDAERVLLVLGQMHGDEPYGRYVVKRLRKLKASKGTAIWTVSTINPDGAKRRTRRNARQVDLNRNFPDGWLPGIRGSLYYSGPRSASENETRAFMRGMRRIQPDAVVSYHQHANVIDRPSFAKARPWARRLSRDLRLPLRSVSCVTPCAGTLSGWFNTNFPGWAVTVELPRRISAKRQRSMARAMKRLAVDIKPTQDRAPEPAPEPTPEPTESATPEPTQSATPEPSVSPS